MDAAEQPTLFAPHRNHLLFSDSYLDRRVAELREWREADVSELLATLRAIWDRFEPAGTNEAQVEADWVRPVLDALGHRYDVQVSIETPLGARRPDYVLFPDDQTRDASRREGPRRREDLRHALAVMDAKAWDVRLDQPPRGVARRGPDTANPSFQIDGYVRYSGVAWGILTNGRLWRLVHRETSDRLDVFYEVDLPALVEAGDAERLKSFALFFGPAAFDGEPSWLERVLDESRAFARSVGDSLKSQVYEALEHLAQGFLDFPGNGLSPTPETLREINDHSLVLLYRLLFTLFAESRDLLPLADSEAYQRSYSLSAIKRRVAGDLTRGAPAGATLDALWGDLQRLWAILDRGNPELGVPAFDGGLFDPKATHSARDAEAVAAGAAPFLERCRVGDRSLRLAIDLLARVDDPESGARAFVDYRDLDVRHLGSVYEGLLEHRLRYADVALRARSAGSGMVFEPLAGGVDPTASDIAAGSVYLLTDKGERKTSGSYYTPEALVERIVAYTLDPVLAAVRARHAGGDGEIPAVAGDGFVRDALSLNILDPAMGSGHFLVTATDHVARWLVEQSLPPADDLGDADETDYWRRRVVQACIYGVDVNPLAVELAKLSLWLRTVSRDRPLSFLDHHLRCGDSLLGAKVDELQTSAPRRRASGGTRSEARKRKAAAAGQLSMLDDSAFAGAMGAAWDLMERIEDMEARTVDDVHEAAALYGRVRGEVTRKYRRLADAATARHFGLDIDDETWAALVRHESAGGFDLPQFAELMERAAALAAEHRFFHWELEFPEVFFDRYGRVPEDAGFDAVIGNPPWERIKLQENEFFSARDPKIAAAPRASDRKAMIRALPDVSPVLWEEYRRAKARADATLRYVRSSGHFPLMGRGDTNTYAVFAERAVDLVSPVGRAGLLVPSGIATDHSTRHFFQMLVQERRLERLHDFENRRKLFEDVDSRFKFSIIVMAGENTGIEAVRTGFFLHGTEELDDPDRIFDLSADDFRRFNPNTLTCPVFRRRRDYELTRKIYEAAPVLIDRSGKEEVNPWGVKFLRMFDMTNDSHLFRTADELEGEGFWLGAGNVYSRGGERYLPLYEGKMVQMYDHRAANVVVNPENVHRAAIAAPVGLAGHSDPSFSPSPQFWTSGDAVAQALDFVSPSWLIAFKDVTSPTNVRTMIAAAIPAVAVGNSLPIVATNDESSAAMLLANLCSLALDAMARQKVGGQHLNFFIVEQLPVLPLSRYDTPFHGTPLVPWITERVLELTYTAHDIKGFADALGYDGPPFAWDEERRLHLRCQLDALYFHLYGLSRDDITDILETFPIVKRQDKAAFGRFRTWELIDAYFRAYAAGDMGAWVKG